MKEWMNENMNLTYISFSSSFIICLVKTGRAKERKKFCCKYNKVENKSVEVEKCIASRL